MTAKIICLAQSKGGTAKTSSVVNIAAAMRKAGTSVLVVDLDPQANLTSYLGIEPTSLERTNFELFTTPAPAESLIVETQEGIDLLPGSIDLGVVETNLRDKLGREKILARKLAPIANDYDYIVCDTSPYLSLLTTNGMVAADYILIPFQPEPGCVAGFTQIYNQFLLVQDNLNPNARLLGIAVVLYDGRITGHQRLTDQLRLDWADSVFDTIVRRRSNILGATMIGKSVVTADPNSDLAQDYVNLTREIISRAN